MRSGVGFGTVNDAISATVPQNHPVCSADSFDEGVPLILKA